MSFYVTVAPKAEFTQWLEVQAGEAQTPTTELGRRGQERFLANGCGACHAVRGTPAAGLIGPDLTHVGTRLSISAGVLTNTAETFEQWVSHPERIKPGVQMPAFDMLPQLDRATIAAYLEELK
jgi:cytochrome c oxidase subunit II